MYFPKNIADCIVIKESVHRKSVEPHTHTSNLFGFDFELVYVLEGEAEHLIDGRREHILQSDFFMLDFGVSHGYLVEEGKELRLLNLIFDHRAIDLSEKTAACLADIAAKRLITTPDEGSYGVRTDYRFHDESGATLALFRKILKEMNARLPGYYEISRGALMEILIGAFRVYFHKNETPKLSEPIKFIRDYVNDYYMLSTTLSELARELGMSLPYLSARFREEMGMTYSEFLHRRRVDESMRLIANSDTPIELIAEYVGYSDSKKLRERFRAIVGKSPREFKKSLK